MGSEMCIRDRDSDVKTKRAEFINTCMNLNNEYENILPQNQVQLLRLYNSHFTGSSTWNFNSEPVKQLWNSWNVNLRVIFGLPMASHCWIGERLTGGKHAKQLMYSRWVKFFWIHLQSVRSHK